MLLDPPSTAALFPEAVLDVPPAIVAQVPDKVWPDPMLSLQPSTSPLTQTPQLSIVGPLTVKLPVIDTLPVNW